MSTRLRLGYITAEQKETLIEFLKQNPELKSGKFSASFTAKDAQRKWMALAEELHKIPNGATKDWKQWRKTWQDLCSKTKAKHSQISKYTKGTGGGPFLSASEQLTSTKQQVLETMNATVISGHNIAETEVSFEFEDVEFLDEYQHVAHSEPMNKGAIDINTNNNEATSCNMQSSYMENETRIIANKENRVLPTNDREKEKNEVENVPMRDKKQTCITQKESHKRTVASRRLEKTMEYTNDLVNLTAKDQELRKKYYRKKLKLMKEDIIIKKRMATALENICNVNTCTKH